MKKIKVGVLFGGMSTESSVSIVSASSIINNLNKEKYEVYPIYIDSAGMYYECQKLKEKYTLSDKIDDINLIDNINTYLKKLDVVFPVLHGKYGEDGCIQGMLEQLKVPYVGCGVLSSSICMDKIYTKIIFEKIGIKTAKSVYIKKYKDKYFYVDKEFNEFEYNLSDITKLIQKDLSYPLFVKPSNSGSSVGITKVNNDKELKQGIITASEYDSKILIEENIIGREIECAVLGNNPIIASTLGEIIPNKEFYSFDAKYNDSSSKLIIPAPINPELSEKIRNIAIRAFRAVGGTGLARVDFFINEENEEIYLNEINTMPGFTEISMYPKLWDYSGINFTILLDRLINLTLEK